MAAVSSSGARHVVTLMARVLSWVGSITPDILGHREELSSLTGEEVSRAIVEQRVLEKRYEELIAVRSQLKVRRAHSDWVARLEANGGDVVFR